MAVPKDNRGRLASAALPLRRLDFSPVFDIRVRLAAEVERTVGDQPKRLLPPGVYRVSAHIAIEGELTLEQLRQLFVAEPALAAAVRVESPEPSPDAQFKSELAQRARHLVQAYQDKLGEGPPDLLPALGSWLKEFEEEVIRRAIADTAEARLPTAKARFAWFKERLRVVRAARRERLMELDEDAEGDE